MLGCLSFLQGSEQIGVKAQKGSEISLIQVGEDSIEKLNQRLQANATALSEQEDVISGNASSSSSRVHWPDILQGVYVGRGGVFRTLTFRAVLAGVGEYTLECENLPGYYLAVDKGINSDGRPFLARVMGYTSQADPRFRFAVYATKKELQMSTY